MKSIRVLVAEDDAMISTLLADILKEMGHEICAIAATEDDAVAAAAQHRPGLMIIDARLGAGSGVAAVETILRSGFVPHLFTSGNVAKVKALRPDAVILEKPFSETQLVDAIQRALTVKGTT